MSLLHIGLCLLLVVGMLTCLGRIFDLDWLFCLGVLCQLLLTKVRSLPCEDR